MYARVHELYGIPWDDDWGPTLQAHVRAAGADGVLLARRITAEDGLLVALFADEEGATAAARLIPPQSGSTSVGAGRVFAVSTVRQGPDAAIPRYLQATWFSGPHDATWIRAVDRADEERIWPAARDVDGLVAALTLQAPDGERLTLVLATRIEAFEEGTRRILTTRLLPGEDPAHLTGPDRADLAHLAVVDLPLQVTR